MPATEPIKKSSQTPKSPQLLSPHGLPGILSTVHTIPSEQRTAGTWPRAAVGDLQQDSWAALFHSHPDILGLLIQLELKEVCEPFVSGIFQTVKAGALLKALVKFLPPLKR